MDAQPLRSLPAAAGPGPHGAGPPPSGARPRAPWTYAAIALLGLAAYLALAVHFAWLCDDAFISLRYAKHLAEGHGLVWNVGEDPRVQGYTNLLWVLLGALFERLGLDPTRALPAVSATCGGLLFALVARALHARAARPAPLVFGLCLAFLATAVPFAVWSTSGLATAPFALALFLLWDGLFGGLASRAGAPSTPRALLGAALLTALRADGAGFALPLALLAVIAGRATGRRALARAGLAAFALALALALADAGWRHAYYGDWVPNTARIKVDLGALTLERGAKYLAAQLATFVSLPIALAVSLCVRPGLVRASALAALLGIATYPLLAGGDFMAMGRLLVPAWPFLAILLAEPLERALGPPDRSRARAAAVACAGVALCLFSLAPGFGFHPVPASVRERFHFRWNEPEPRTELEQWSAMADQSREWALLGRALARHTEPDDTIVLGAIGAAGYYSERTILDRFGLTNRLALEVPRGRHSPGHDREVPFEVLLAARPTWLSASIVPADELAVAQGELDGAWSALTGQVEFKDVVLRTRARRPGTPGGVPLVLHMTRLAR